MDGTLDRKQIEDIDIRLSPAQKNAVLMLYDCSLAYRRCQLQGWITRTDLPGVRRRTFEIISDLGLLETRWVSFERQDAATRVWVYDGSCPNAHAYRLSYDGIVVARSLKKVGYHA